MKVFITTSGVGTKLGDLTKYTNKAMIKIGKKPVIAYIIEQYSSDVEFVISLGYKGSHIKQFLQIAYPQKHFTFVEVDNYDKEGSSQIYSMWCCKKHLQEPFIYNDCDSICNDAVCHDISTSGFTFDWISGTFYDNPYGSANYDSYDINYANKITNMYHRSTNINAHYIYTGICGIYDYEYFWKCIEDALKHDCTTDFDIFYNYYALHQIHQLKHIDIFNWIDTGNIDGIIKARKECKDKLDILNKNNQSIFIINNQVIKFFADDNVTSNLQKRLQQLGPLTHGIKNITTNFISYDYIDGITAISFMNPVMFAYMIDNFNKEGLWNVVKDTHNNFKQNQHKFYIEKTISRVNDFKTKYGITEDADIYINNIKIPKEFTIENMVLQMQDLDEYKTSVPTNWHGDFTLENMIYNGNDWTLIDCRDKFGDAVEYGDRLYDFGKINHNLTLNFSSAINGKYYLYVNNDHINFSIMCDLSVYKCKNILKNFVEEKGIRYDYIDFLSGLNWVNMSPLHPINDLPYLLFFMGKLQMYESLMKLTNKKIYYENINKDYE